MQTTPQPQVAQTAPAVACAGASESLLPRHTAAPLLERLSALVDGECAAVDVELLTRAGTDRELQQAWAQYHCIAAALRNPHEAAAPASPAFVAAVLSGIAQETLRPPAQIATAAHIAAHTAAPAAPAAANDAVFRWKLIAGCASIAAAAAVAWQLVATPVAAPLGAQWAQTAQPAPDAVQVVLTPAGAVMLRDAQLDEFLAAHRQWGGMSALQMPTGFLRNATYQTTQP